jgi:hypothetical protein
LGQSGLLTFSVTSLGGSSSAVISVQGLENQALNASIAPGGDPWTHRSNATYGMSYVSNSISSPGPYRLNLAIGNLATPGTYPIVVMLAGNGERGAESSLNLHIASAVSAGDFDEDGDVDGSDLAMWRAGFGTLAMATHGHGDADADSDVDGADFLIWQRQLGSPPGIVVAASATPEPAAGLLMLLGATATAAIARRCACRRPLTANS